MPKYSHRVALSLVTELHHSFENTDEFDRELLSCKGSFVPCLQPKIDVSISNNVTIVAHMLPFSLYIGMDVKQCIHYRALLRVNTYPEEERGGTALFFSISVSFQKTSVNTDKMNTKYG